MDSERQITPVPMLSVVEGTLFIEAGAPGSSLAYRMGEGSWKIYSGPVALTGSGEIEARAVRYGWQESEVVPLVFAVSSKK